MSANSTFMNNLRPTSAPKVIVKARPSRAGLSDDKENQVNYVSVESSTGTRQSRLKRPLSAASIIERKSTEVKVLKPVEPVQEGPPEPSLPRTSILLDIIPEGHSLRQELRTADVDFEELLKSKILTKGNTLQDHKKRVDDQKNLIVKLREGLKLQLKVSEYLIGNLVTKEDSFRASEEVLKQQIADLEKNLETIEIETNTASLMIKKLQDEGDVIACKLENGKLENAEMGKKLQALHATHEALKASHEELVQARDKLLSQLAEQDKEMKQLKQARELAQISHDKELNELRAQLGTEMVSNHENKSKYNALVEAHGEAKTRIAVVEEQVRGCRAEIERAEREREDLQAQLVRMAAEREACAARAAEAAVRSEAKEAQQAETLRSLMAAQDMQLQRLRELAAERDDVADKLAVARAETEEAWADARSVRGELQQASIDLRVSDTELRHARAAAEAAAREAEAAREAAREVARERSEAVERVAGLEAENRVFREQAQSPQLQQLELVVRAQRDAAAMQAALHSGHADLAAARTEVQRLAEDKAELERRLAAAEAARRKLHNEVQELKGNVRVFGRLRPSSRRESLEEGDCPLEVSEAAGHVTMQVAGAAHEFRFDRVFGQGAGQADVFDEVRHYVQSALDGYKVSLLAYGQTGAGKTHTMLGAEGEHRGIVPRAVELILAGVQEAAASGWSYTLEASCVEIYNETLRDLLADSRDEGPGLALRQGEAGVEVPDATRVPVRSLDDVARVLRAMERNRTVRGTAMNERSSRSHTVFQLDMAGAKGRQRLQGSLSLVDLAGSERLDKSGAVGDRLKETQAINKSLSALADVFAAISRKQAHVPFRNSKLTWLLQPCLSGDGKALMLMALSPAAASAHESLCTLRFSALVSQCQLGKPTRYVAVLPPGPDSRPTSEDEAAPPAKRPVSAASSADKRRRNV